MIFIAKLKSLISQLQSEIKPRRYEPSLRVTEILKDEEEEYTVAIQVRNKSTVFYSKPEELLADDRLVEKFSPLDVRTLTYLGYLGINSPKYKILAKKLSNSDKKLSFILKKRGDKSYVTKTIEEIFNEENLFKNLDPEDARTVGYAIAEEDIKQEKRQKEILLKQHVANMNNK